MSTDRRFRSSTPDFCVLDCETTGLGAQRRIVEFACAVVTADGEVVDFFESLVNPGCAISATDVHGLSATSVVDAPAFNDMAGVIESFLRDRVPVAHNFRFDWVTLRTEFARLGVALPSHPPAVCTATLAGQLLGGRTSLRELCQRLGISAPGLHTAAGDVRATVALLTTLLERGARVPRLRPLAPVPGAWRLAIDRGAARVRPVVVADAPPLSSRGGLA